jgi:hypothetical protein
MYNTALVRKLLKEFAKEYATKKKSDPKMIRVFNILIAELEAQMITEQQK